MSRTDKPTGSTIDPARDLKIYLEAHRTVVAQLDLLTKAQLRELIYLSGGMRDLAEFCLQTLSKE